jgi:hypothetical protein
VATAAEGLLAAPSHHPHLFPRLTFPPGYDDDKGDITSLSPPFISQASPSSAATLSFPPPSRLSIFPPRRRLPLLRPRPTEASSWRLRARRGRRPRRWMSRLQRADSGVLSSKTADATRNLTEGDSGEGGSAGVVAAASSDILLSSKGKKGTNKLKLKTRQSSPFWTCALFFASGGFCPTAVPPPSSARPLLLSCSTTTTSPPPSPFCKRQR